MTHIVPAVPSQDALGMPDGAVSDTVAQRPAHVLVVVQPDWRGWQKAMVPVAALESVHWYRPSGAPRPLIHAYVPCNALVSGDVPHDCQDGQPHRLRVCVLKCHTPPVVFDELAARADAAERVPS